MKPFSPLQEGWVGLSEGQDFCGLNSPGRGVQSIPEMAQGRAHRLAVSVPALPCRTLGEQLSVPEVGFLLCFW